MMILGFTLGRGVTSSHIVSNRLGGWWLGDDFFLFFFSLYSFLFFCLVSVIFIAFSLCFGVADGKALIPTPIRQATTSTD
jgi:hypothetical protein